MDRRRLLVTCALLMFITCGVVTQDSGDSDTDETYDDGEATYFYEDDQESGSVLSTGNITEVIEEADSELNAEEEEETDIATQISNNPDNTMRASNIADHFMGSSQAAAKMSRSSRLVQRVLDELCKRYGYSKEDIEELIKTGGIGHVLTDVYEDIHEHMIMPKPKRRRCPYPKGAIKCQRGARYRTIDGSCNNRRHPFWGKAMRAFRRVLSPDYGDGHNSPRESVRPNNPLPSARTVSRTIHNDVSVPSQIATNLHMTFGQLLDHDIDRTAVTKLLDENDKLVDVPCGTDGCTTTGVENAACFPIPTEPDDPTFGGGPGCLKFVRATEAITDRCPTGFREQLNQITSYMDASMVYGSDLDRFNLLRDPDMTRGKMATSDGPTPTSKRFMPRVDLADCQNTNNLIKCFFSGDTRTNEQAALSSLHTIFVREHNRIEEELYALHPEWNGTVLFEESRRIVVAIWQVITFNEYLPLLLGQETMKNEGLELLSQGYFKGYDKRLNADTANVFATAAFRCGHSQVSNFILLINRLYDETTAFNEFLSNLFFRPAVHYDTLVQGGFGMDAVMRGQVVAPAETLDAHFASSVTNNMFTLTPPHGPGTDLAALNTQRGRDHGLPSYRKWRKFCRLSVPKNFYNMDDIPYDLQAKLAGLYGSVKDVDLFTGAMSERQLPGSMLGPTFTCLLSDQFRRYKFGDRYWHETNNRNIKFTRGQLQQIRKVTFARLMCDNLDDIDTVQRFAMMLPLSEALQLPNIVDFYALLKFYEGDDNERRPCDDIPGIDFSHWA